MTDAPLSERVLVLAPSGRDAAIASAVLREASIAADACADLTELCVRLEQEAAVALVVEEALIDADATCLSEWIEKQPAWSDFPFVVLSPRGGGLERNPAAGRLLTMLGNVTFLERPFHPTTLVSVVRTAFRGRLRQYEARERMEEIKRGEALLERRVEERTSELEAANRQLASQITERERVESALRQAQRLEAVGQLTSGVAHDFNNLLTVILGNVRQMQKGATDAAQTRRLNMMAEAGERGAKLTAQMLAFSRRQKLEPKPVDLNETVASMRDLLQSTMGGSVRIETVLAKRLWPAMIDPTQIELAILNLAINARDAMAVGGTLAVETSNVSLGEPRSPSEPPPGEYICVSVSDTGSGMPDDVVTKVFEPFFTTKEVGKGSGLGLSQVLGLAKQSGGGVRIQTKVGEGTSVKLYLPRASTATEVEPAPPPAAVTQRASGLTILLVDDDSAVREVTRSILQDLGYAVVEAGSGGACLDMLDTHKDIDLVLLDFAMPGMNGADVAREIRARSASMPILFATGYADADALTEADEDGIVRKPFVESELADKLSRALNRTPDTAKIIPIRR
ncbi:histidine kinase [Terrihabitans soli]|uniref:histidine kinase n=1 Tax=Terrihabitans soli TaxID=708113 RepID=A0A6S6QSS7_9HYPH|nr:response regulator [Terrihabitans soli]BCJ89980.1 histidine kinase [Terrihabitans soli]